MNKKMSNGKDKKEVKEKPYGYIVSVPVKFCNAEIPDREIRVKTVYADNGLQYWDFVNNISGAINGDFVVTESQNDSQKKYYSCYFLRDDFMTKMKYIYSEGSEKDKAKKCGLALIRENLLAKAEEIERKLCMDMNCDNGFQFEEGEVVCLVNRGGVYTTFWDAYAILAHRAYRNNKYLCGPFVYGNLSFADDNDRSFPKKTILLKILARTSVVDGTGCLVNLYLVADEEEADTCYDNPPPLDVYIIHEDSIAKYNDDSKKKRKGR